MLYKSVKRRRKQRCVLNILMILTGHSNTGKGAYAKFLRRDHGAVILPTGEYYRARSKRDKAFREKTEPYTKKGRYVPDEIHIPILERLLVRALKKSPRILVVDGGVRTLGQAEALLRKAFPFKNYKIVVVVLTALEEVCWNRAQVAARGLDKNRSPRPDDKGGKKVFNRRRKEFNTKSVPAIRFLEDAQITTRPLDGTKINKTFFRRGAKILREN